MKALLLEDDQSLVPLLVAKLQAEGCSVTIHGSKWAAAAAIRKTRFDVILVAKIISDSDCISVLRAIRTNPLTVKTPVFIIDIDIHGNHAAAQWEKDAFDGVVRGPSDIETMIKHLAGNK